MRNKMWRHLERKGGGGGDLGVTGGHASEVLLKNILWKKIVGEKFQVGP
jgi:hypothetical protein